MQHIFPLTAIRGIAAFLLAIGHYHFAIAPIDVTIFVNLTHYGMLFVDGFFVLSGFILAYIYSVSFTTLSHLRKNTERFLIVRLARIYPLHLFTLMVMMLFHYGGVIQDNTILAEPEYNDGKHLLFSLFLMQGWGLPEIHHAWNTPSWTISVEWLMYLLFPLIILLINTINRLPLWLPTLCHVVIITSIMTWFSFTIIDHNTALPALWSNDPIRGGGLFVVGLSLYHLFAKNFLKFLPWDIITISIIIIGTYGILQLWPINFMIIFVPVATYCLAQMKSFAFVIFANRPLVYMGEISYSIYLWHVPYAIIMAQLFEINPEGFWTGYGLLFLAGLLLLSSFSYHYIENPCRKFVKNKISKAPINKPPISEENSSTKSTNNNT